MSKIWPFLVQKKSLLKTGAFVALTFFGLFFTILYFNQAQKCQVSDSEVPPFVTMYAGPTIQNACNKALAICSYYSKKPRDCKVIVKE